MACARDRGAPRCAATCTGSGPPPAIAVDEKSTNCSFAPLPFAWWAVSATPAPVAITRIPTRTARKAYMAFVGGGGGTNGCLAGCALCPPQVTLLPVVLHTRLLSWGRCKLSGGRRVGE